MSETPEHLSLKEDIARTEKSVGSGIANSIDRAVEEAMTQHPNLARFVVGRLGKALNSKERILIAETALTTYYIVRSFSPDKEVHPNLLIAVVEQDIDARRKDKNSIFQSIQDDMKDHQDLAVYLTDKMKESVSLEEANLIGETSLVVYDALIDLA